MLRLLCIASLALAACSSNGPAFARVQNPPVLAAERLELRLTDERPSVTARPHVPEFTLPGNGQDLSPPLGPELQDKLERALRMHLVRAARRLRVEVHVHEALGSWSGNWFTESEKGSARVSVSVFDDAGEQPFVTGEGTSWAVRTQFDVSDQGVMDMVELAVQAAVFEFLASEAAAGARMTQRAGTAN